MTKNRTARPTTTTSRAQIIDEVSKRVAEAAKSLTFHGFAREVGLSTATMKLLIDKDIPDLTTSAKRRRAWARMLMRLAEYFDRDARAWIEGFGIPWSEVSRAPLRRTAQPAVSLDVGDPVINAIRRASGSRFRGTVHVWTSRLFPFQPKDAPGESFFRAYARRLIGSINPDWRVEFHDFVEVDQAMRNLTEAVDECHIALGLFDTLPRRQQDVTFLPLPGWRARLGAVWIDTDVTPSWRRLMDKLHRPVLIRGEAGDHFIRGGCGYSDDECEFVTTYEPSEIAAALWDAHAQRRDKARAAVLVADEQTCREVIAIGDEKGWALALMPQSRDDIPPPSFAVATAVRSDARKWCELLRVAQSDMMFGPLAPKTALDYADVLYRLFLTPSGTGIGLQHFEEATELFVEVLARELQKRLHRLGVSDIPGQVTGMLPATWWKSAAAALGETSTVPVPHDVLEVIARLDESLKAGEVNQARHRVSELQDRLRPADVALGRESTDASTTIRRLTA